MDTTDTGPDIDLTEATDPERDVTNRTNSAARTRMAQLIWDIRHGHQTLERDTLAAWTYTNREARAIIHAANRTNHETVTLAGTIVDNLRIEGSVDGNLDVLGSVGGDLGVWGSVGGGLDVLGSVGGHLSVFGSGSVGGDLRLSGSVGGDLVVVGSVGGDLGVWGLVGGHLAVWGSVDGTLDVSGLVGGGLGVWGLVGGDLRLSGSVDGTLDVSGSGSVGGDLAVSGSVGGDLGVAGTVTGVMAATGAFEGRVVLTPSEMMQLGSLRGARFGDEVFIGDLVDVSRCDMGQSPDLDKLRLVGSDLFPKGTTGLANPPAGRSKALSAGEMASIYRQLRTNLESRKNRPQAGLFYRGEMNARRQDAAAQGRWFECGLLWLYRLLSGYGLRPWPAFGWFVAVAVAAAMWFRTGAGLDLDDGPLVELAGARDALNFSLKSMVSFFRPPQADLTTTQDSVQLGLRFVGPVLLAQVVLAVRERVAR